jgi:hypothetical protein
MRIVEVRHGLLEIQARMTPRWTRLAKCQPPVAIPKSRMHMWFRHCTEYTCMFTKLGKGHFGLCSRARADRGCMVRNKIRIKFRIIFQNICITFQLCSREHAWSILESIAASLVVAGRAFSLREGVRVHTFAKSPTSVCVRRCNYPAGIRVSKVHSSK